MSTAQQAKVSLSIIDTILAIECKKQLGTVEVATEDLQALADEVKRLQNGLQTIINSQDASYIRYYATRMLKGESL